MGRAWVAMAYSNKKESFDEQLSGLAADFYAEPLDFVMFAFPWGEHPDLRLIDWHDEGKFVDTDTGFHMDVRPAMSDVVVTHREWMADYSKRYNNARYGPDRWVCEFFDEVGREVKKRGFDGKHPVEPLRMLTVSGHGIGKSASLAMLLNWVMVTRSGCKGTVSANKQDQLRFRTWAELGKWWGKSVYRHWFCYSNNRNNMAFQHKSYLKTKDWVIAAQTSSVDNSESFAGQHAPNSTSLYAFDEASGIVDKLYEVRDGGMISGEPMAFDYGNPTRNYGYFKENAEGRFKHLWISRHIDSRRVYMSNKKELQSRADAYGEDSDYFKIRVRGMFPLKSSLQFIPTSWVHDAMKRETPSLDHGFRGVVSIGVDVARFGDDQTVIYPVLGSDARTYAPKPGDGIFSGLDTLQVVMKIIEKLQFFEAEGYEVGFLGIDAGAGAGVIDVLRTKGYDCSEISFGGRPVFEPHAYRHRGDEMWGRGKEAIRERLVLPDLSTDIGADLLAEMTNREYDFYMGGNLMHLETKKEMKSRGMKSPNLSDALFINFAEDFHNMVVPDFVLSKGVKAGMTDYEYDPLDNVTVN